MNFMQDLWSGKMEIKFGEITGKSLLKALKNTPLLLVALLLGGLYMVVLAIDWISCRVNYYSKVQIKNTKNKISGLTH